MGLSKETTCLWGLTAMRPYEAAQPKLIPASSTIVYEQSRMAEIKFFIKNSGVSKNSYIINTITNKNNFGCVALYGRVASRPHRHVTFLVMPFCDLRTGKTLWVNPLA